ncbi:MAG: hypothetical protein AABW49_03740 [Nanoarchaeota archaeon]
MGRNKSKQKKGTIELSITTIVVVFIGIVLLILGVSFVQNVFSKIDTTAEKSFDQLDTFVEQLGIEGSFSAPSNIEVEQGESKIFKIIVGHDGLVPSPSTFVVSLKRTQGEAGTATEAQVKAKIIDDTQKSIKSGQQINFPVQVIATKDALLAVDGSYPSYSIDVKVLGQSESYESGAFQIAVVPSSGVFGGLFG